jgi:3-deoxy-manno-octulosonate cytidylyltransferase (CMP-KDO synthetase)|tara:strand:- start:318 stop:1010 length:693 start_codon:yes stop_codon:yes gene_type:complete
MKGNRLPGKPLIKILGKAIIQHVWERCVKVMDRENIYIATEDEIISDYCKKNNIKCVLTGPADTAIDRIKFFSDTIKSDSYINIQGDEPIVNIEDIKTLIEYNKKYPNRVVFGKAKANLDEFNDHSKAKVVCDLKGKLLYSSRAGIPLNNKGKYVSAQRAIWLYAFNKAALDKYNEYSNKTFLDMLEDNEIIRFLEIDVPVYCVDMIGDSWAVDEEKDLKIVEERLKKIT